MKKVLLIALVLAAGCHHKQTSTDDGEEHQAPVGKGDGPVYTEGSQIPPEKMDEVNRMLQRREPSVSRCLAMVVDNKDLPKNSRGKMTVSMTIGTNGTASDLKVDSDTLNSKPLEDCVVGKIKEIPFPQVPKPYPTSYTYGFEAM